MKKIIVILITIASCTSKRENKILQSSTDNRGLTSVIFIDSNKDTVALDYLTAKELDSLKNK